MALGLSVCITLFFKGDFSLKLYAFVIVPLLFLPL
jgi:hypothetical protein